MLAAFPDMVSLFLLSNVVLITVIIIITVISCGYKFSEQVAFVVQAT